MKTKRGGKRKGAGRKNLPNKEKGYGLILWIKPLCVNYDEPKKIRRYLYNCLDEYLH